MKHKALTTLCAAVLVITGCAIDGKWSLSNELALKRNRDGRKVIATFQRKPQ